MVFHAHQRDVYLERSVAQEAQKLGFRNLFCWHEVYDGNFQRADVLGGGALGRHYEDIFTFQNLSCRQIRIYFYRHKDSYIILPTL